MTDTLRFFMLFRLCLPKPCNIPSSKAILHSVKHQFQIHKFKTAGRSVPRTTQNAKFNTPNCLRQLPLAPGKYRAYGKKSLQKEISFQSARVYRNCRQTSVRVQYICYHTVIYVLLGCNIYIIGVQYICYHAAIYMELGLRKAVFGGKKHIYNGQNRKIWYPSDCTPSTQRHIPSCITAHYGCTPKTVKKTHRHSFGDFRASFEPLQMQILSWQSL